MNVETGLVEIKRFNKQEMPMTTSVDVAETFGKPHKNVLRDIRELISKDEQFSRLNFEQSTYVNERGKEYPMYLMTRDGFTLLVMGYTGELAMKFKIAYINAFNRMETLLWEKRIERAKGKAARRALTDVIQELYGTITKDTKPNPYAKYTEIAYMTAFGKHTRQLRKEKGLRKNDNLRDYLNASELKALSKVEHSLFSLLELGWDDAKIAEFLESNFKAPALEAGEEHEEE